MASASSWAAGGRTSRSMLMAAPWTESGQASWANRCSRSAAGGSPSCSTTMSSSGFVRASSTVAVSRRSATSGSASRASAVRTSAKTRTGWSQPWAATWVSVSVTARASA